MDVLIIEDERIASLKLEQLLKEADPEIRVMASIATIRDAVVWLRSNSPDLIFSDIHLSDGLSFNIFDQVDISTPVIFTTAYDQYAIEAFRVNSIDYLLKPVEIGKLEQSIEKFKSVTGKRHSGKMEIESLIKAFVNQEDPYKKRFVITIGSKVKMVNVEEIAYFYVQDKSSYIQTRTKQSVAIDHSLNELEKMINPKHFFRVNRKYLVHIDAIENIFILSKSRIKLALRPPTEEAIIISFGRSRDFKNWINN
jgi:two-component system, LytTR family, response regulator